LKDVVEDVEVDVVHPVGAVEVSEVEVVVEPAVVSLVDLNTQPLDN
jgi:hypothetical protein